VSLSKVQQELAGILTQRSPAVVTDPSLAQASVAVIVGSEPDAVLVIRRAERIGDPWSGHMGFPGGRRDSADEHLLATAIRETEEEVGVRLGLENLIGSLDDIGPRSTASPSIFARPYVFAVEGHPATSLNQEVASSHWVPLDALRAPGVVGEYTLEVGSTSRTFPAFHLPEGVIWGMTERMLTSLLGLFELSQNS
jgi:8-oxo-dGTP pyrophosphatase MutT (NUDIX family)